MPESEGKVTITGGKDAEVFDGRIVLDGNDISHHVLEAVLTLKPGYLPTLQLTLDPASLDVAATVQILSKVRELIP
jgi:hypothetical protein